MSTADASPINPAEADTPGKPERLPAIDVLRGLVMAVMALDHVRDYFTSARFTWMDPTQTTPAHFFTRWATHFCAPAFFFLAGLGAYLSMARGKSKPELARFLLSRGFVLILFDLTIVRVGWDFNFHFDGGPWFIVLSTLGMSMMVLAGLIFLPVWGVALFAAVIIGGHNYFDRVAPEQLGSLSPLWTLLHVRASAHVGRIPFYVSYPLVPWVGVMAAGYALGPVMLMERTKRRRNLRRIGASLLVGFVLLRIMNVYGDPRPWSTVEYGGIENLMAFLRVKKYPPSLLYVLMTLGLIVLSLAWLENLKGPLQRWLTTFGRVPLFFYLLHLYVIHGLALLVGVSRGNDPRDFLVPYFRLPRDFGFGLPAVYSAWIIVLLVMYPCSEWFGNLKKRSKAVWLSYL